MYSIDSWDSEWFYLYLEGALAYSEQFVYWDGDGDDCGNGYYNDRTVDVDVTIDHTAACLELYLTSNLDEDATNESWGIANLVVSYISDDECEVIDTDLCNEEILSD